MMNVQKLLIGLGITLAPFWVYATNSAEAVYCPWKSWSETLRFDQSTFQLRMSEYVRLLSVTESENITTFNVEILSPDDDIPDSPNDQLMIMKETQQQYCNIARQCDIGQLPLRLMFYQNQALIGQVSVDKTNCVDNQ